MANNRGVAYIKQGVVEAQSIDFPKKEEFKREPEKSSQECVWRKSPRRKAHLR
jgi:hypothetical protein